MSFPLGGCFLGGGGRGSALRNKALLSPSSSFCFCSFHFPSYQKPPCGGNAFSSPFPVISFACLPWHLFRAGPHHPATATFSVFTSWLPFPPRYWQTVSILSRVPFTFAIPVGHSWRFFILQTLGEGAGAAFWPLSLASYHQPSGVKGRELVCSSLMLPGESERDFWEAFTCHSFLELQVPISPQWCLLEKQKWNNVVLSKLPLLPVKNSSPVEASKFHLSWLCLNDSDLVPRTLSASFHFSVLVWLNLAHSYLTIF